MTMAFRVLFSLIAMSVVTRLVSGNFYADSDVMWAPDNVEYIDGGNIVALTLDYNSGCGIASKNPCLFGEVTMGIKLVNGNSAGTVATFYLASDGANHDEVDFEFLGNTSGNPYILHTNLFAQGEGEKEQQFYLWFDPTADFHNYTFIWNPYQIAFLVDDIPVRVYNNHMADGIPFPHNQSMYVYCSLWDAEDWATEGGREKTDWSSAPFIAYYENFVLDACIPDYVPNNDCLSASSWAPWYNQMANVTTLQSVQDNYMIYNYCTDANRFPNGFPPECYYSN